jgi:hypothetical protein
LTAVSLAALSVAGLGVLYAGAAPDKAPTEVSEMVSGGATSAQEADMSEHGLAAMNDIHLARMAINDGYLDSAKKLLDEAHTLIGRMTSEDLPVTVTTEIKVGDKTTEKQTVTRQPDLIPILSEMQVVEAFADQAADAAESEGPSSQGIAAEKSGADKTSDKTKAQHANDAKVAAVGQAREQLQQGDRKGAVETLRLVDLALVSRVVSMPLKETAAHVDKAITLVNEGKLHEANLELKQAKDALTVDTVVLSDPTADVTPVSGDTGKAEPAHKANSLAAHAK